MIWAVVVSVLSWLCPSRPVQGPRAVFQPQGLVRIVKPLVLKARYDGLVAQPDSILGALEVTKASN